MANDSGTIEGGQVNTILDDFWPNFNVDGPYFDVEECAQAGDSMATFVLDQYGIDYMGSKGGDLGSIDIKRMDALTVINQSLMQELTGGKVVEAMVNEAGYVEFVEIGSSGAGITDVYYTVQTHAYTDTAKGIMVTGKKPLPLRKKIEWKPIWGEGADANVHIYNYRDMLANCNIAAFSRYATITFNDPYLDSKYEDGIDNLFDLTDPWTTLMGYVYWKDIPKEMRAEHKEFTIEYTKTTTIPVKVGFGDAAPEGPIALVQQMADLGSKLTSLPQYDSDATAGNCWSDPNQGVPVVPEDGVAIPIRTEDFKDLLYTNVRGEEIDKFIRVSDVYVVGVVVDYCKSAPASDPDAKLSAAGEPYKYKVWVSIEDRQSKAFKLNEKTNYAITFPEDKEEGSYAPDPYIVFAKDTKAGDPAEYGTATTFYLDLGCRVAREEEEVPSGAFIGSILPMDKNRAILVEEVWAMIELDSPSLVVNDPKGAAADIADKLVYYLGAMKVRKPPAPIGYAGVSKRRGTLVDQTTGIQDNDPTTAEYTEQKSEIEQYYNDMQGGGMALTLSFLEEDEVADVARVLYEFMNPDRDVVSTVHTCGPCAVPKLGRYGTSGVVNSIQYSYSDKGSYTISVQEGPNLVGGFTAVDGGPTQKMAEDYPSQARIIQDVGNGVHYKISIDGFGERWAISTVAQVLRVGDIVSATVHNNPVEA